MAKRLTNVNMPRKCKKPEQEMAKRILVTGLRVYKNNCED
jgi:hypothetical protein